MGEIADALRRDQKANARSGSARPEPAQGQPAPVRKSAPPARSPQVTPDSPAPSRSSDGADLVSGQRVAQEMHAIEPAPLPEADEKDELARAEREAIRASVEAQSVPRVPVAPAPQTISRMANPETDAARISITDPAANASHRYRHMAIRLSRSAAEQGAEAILVTSPEMGDGKTTTACNLAIALSRLDESRRVALIDLDLHRPAVARNLGLEVPVSIADVLRGEASVQEALVPTDVGGLHVMASSERTKDVGALVSSSRLRALLADLRQEFSMILLDTPPILVTSDAASILNVADACLLVTSAGLSSTRLVEEALAQVPREKMIGACVNRARVTAARPEYGYGDYGAHATPEPEVSEEAAPAPPRKGKKKRAKKGGRR